MRNSSLPLVAINFSSGAGNPFAKHFTVAGLFARILRDCGVMVTPVGRTSEKS